MNTIEARELTKRFTLAAQHPSAATFSDWIARAGARRRSAAETFVALDSVSFAVSPGETLGVIGKNGAGKSTLLKLLSRILRPTSGEITLRGRVGSLLEIGAGFHPELTGRENIFLNGSILGMRQSEITRKLDEIVDFAGIGRHLDQPVKHYSSGMYMRLAFAVAAHIEPEILLLDEVLAVGDAEFQQKCMARIEQLSRNGQTIVFVSHNIPAMLRLCSRAFLLDRGRIVEDGSARDVVAAYRKLRHPAAEHSFSGGLTPPGSSHVRLRRIRIRARSGETVKAVDIESEFGIEMDFEVLTAGLILFPSLIVNGEYGELFRSIDASSESHAKPRAPGLYRVVAWVPPNLLAPGPLTVTAAMYSQFPDAEHFVESDVVSFEAIEAGGGSRGHYRGHFGGVIRPWLEWSVEYFPAPDAELSLAPGRHSKN